MLSTSRGISRLSGAAWLAAVVGLTAAAAEPALVEPMLVKVEQGDGAVMAGRLERIDAAGVQLVAASTADAKPLTLPLERVRAIRRTDAAKTLPAKLVVTLVDGSTLSGDEVAWDGKQPAVLERPEGRIEIPAGRIRAIAWRSPAASDDSSLRWQAAVPEGTESDLVVVGTAESYEFVECAITAISADTVTVVLDEATIPVKRSKVIGMQWLRAAAGSAAGAGAAAALGAVEAQARVRVDVSDGSLQASRVEWSPEALVIDGEIRLPAAMLEGVDYAAGRMVALAGLTPEKLEVEPWFGALVRTKELAALAGFFAPRIIDSGTSGAVSGMAAGFGPPDIIMRPRTVAIWRLPPDSRRFRAVVAAVAGPQAADVTVVAVSVDDRELFRRQIDATAGAAADATGDASPQALEGISIDVDLTAGRRLAVTVDFGAGGGIGGAVRFIAPVIER